MNNCVIIVAATEAEVKPLIDFFKASKLAGTNAFSFQYKKFVFRIFIAGVGAPQTIYNLLSELIVTKPLLVINAGICGAFNRKLKLTETVFITEDCFADIGAEDDDTFLSVYDLNLDSVKTHPFKNGKLKISKYPDLKAFEKLEKVKAITVNTTHGNERSIAMFQKKYQPDIESMEGAAVIYTCQRMKVPVIQIRSISNYVEKRNRANWKIQEAVISLNQNLIKIVKELAKGN